MASWGKQYDDEVAFSELLDTFSIEEMEELEEVFALEDSELVEFYNQDHDPATGRFDVGADGPGRARDNAAKSEKVLGKKAPQWAKDLLSRKRGAAQAEASKGVGKHAPAYLKDMLKRKVEESVNRGDASAHAGSVTAPSTTPSRIRAEKKRKAASPKA